MMQRLKPAVLALLLLLAACTPNTDLGVTQPATLNIVSVVDPISDLVRQIGGERVEVRSLVPSGSDAHSYAPRPRDALRLNAADLYVGVGLSLNDTALNLARANMADPSRIVLIGEALAGEQLLNNSADDSGLNPHIWTSVTNVIAAVPVIRDALIAIDPQATDTYRHNADALLASLNILDATIRQAVATIPDSQRVLVTFHDAWAYFARDYKLTYAVAVQGRDYTDPSAQAVRALIDQIGTLEVTAVFGSAVFPSDVLRVIAEETGATYLTGLSDDLFPEQLSEPTYQQLLLYNARIIVGGLGGDVATLN